jgi:RNA polymerase subunit RPABC4/transcription elongation factor Spt4
VDSSELKTQNSELKTFVCRFCQGVAYEPGSTCPHCGREVMALCPQCKRYVDNQLEQCDQCGAPLARVGDLAHALSAPAAERAQAPEIDTRLPAPPRTLNDAQWREALVLPSVVAALAMLSWLIVLAVILIPASRNDPSGLTLALAVGGWLYPLAVIIQAGQIFRFRYALLRFGAAVRGQITRSEGRTTQHRLSQIVSFTFVDARGETRYGAVSPFGSLSDVRSGDPVTVLYLPEEPARCSIYPFLF